MKGSLKRLIAGIEKGWKKVPDTNHYIYSDTDYDGNVTSCCAVGHAALGLYGSARKFIEVEDEFKAIQVVNPTYDRLAKDRFTYVGDIKGDKTISLPVAMSLLVASHEDGGYNWTTPQVIEWLKSHV